MDQDATPANGEASLLFVEDDSSLAEALRRILRGEGYAAEWARDGIAALGRLERKAYCLAIVDLGLPAMDGFELLRRVRERQPGLPVLILSARQEPREKVRALDLGADDYLGKPFSMSELLARIRALLRRREEAQPGAPIIRGRLRYDRAAALAWIGERPLPLSPQEACLLDALLARYGKLVAREQLLAGLSSRTRETGSNTIEVYVHRLRRKLAGSELAIRTVYGRGYMLGPVQAPCEQAPADEIPGTSAPPRPRPGRADRES